MAKSNDRLSIVKKHLSAGSNAGESIQSSECAASSTKPKILVDPKPSVIPKRRWAIISSFKCKCIGTLLFLCSFRGV
jgi:hypothetical protein